MNGSTRPIVARVAAAAALTLTLLAAGDAGANAGTFCTNLSIELVGQGPAGVRAKWQNPPPSSSWAQAFTRDVTLGESFRASDSGIFNPGTFRAIFSKTESGTGRKWIVGNTYEVTLVLHDVPTSDGMDICPPLTRGPVQFTYADPYRHLTPNPWPSKYLAADTPVGQSALLEFDVLNDGSNPMSLGVTMNGEGFAYESASPLAIDVGETKSVTFRFAPTRLNFHGSSARFADAGSTFFLDLFFEGRGTAPLGDLTADTAEIDFGKLRGPPAPRTVRVTNNTGVTLLVSLKKPASPFAATPAGNLEIESGASVSIDVTIEKKVKKNPLTAALAFGIKGRKGLALNIPVKALVPNSLVVTNVSGVVQVRQSGGEFRDVLPGEELDDSYEIATDPDSRADLLLADGSLATIGKASQVKVAAFYKKGGIVQTEILMTIGELRSRIPKSELFKSDFKVRPPTATASVRGTDFDTIHDAVTGLTTFRVREGLVLVDPLGAKLKNVALGAGFEVVVGPDSVGEPAAITK